MQMELLGAGYTKYSEWMQHSSIEKMVFVDVKTHLETLDHLPIYNCCLVGDSHIWTALGGSSIYAPTKSGFRINIALATPFNSILLTPAKAFEWKWRLAWTAFRNPTTGGDESRSSDLIVTTGTY